MNGQIDCVTVTFDSFICNLYESGLFKINYCIQFVFLG